MTDEDSPNNRRELLEIALGEQLNALLSASHALNVTTSARFDSSLQPAAFHIVRWLYAYGPSSAATLAESTAMDRSSVSRLIKQLETLGYVKKEAAPNDRRGVVISLTETGQQKITSALKEKGSVFFERISTWSDAELNDFMQMLRHFNGFSHD
ncbi:MarR family winged helix-turn-helix transcriptional regulator [Paenibacillus monticola]|uniref:MarR family transcriptional regulator n=1 Tax=Paenibacillus monticola TaxID=2666075 RepID=A0A7X2L1Y6_9BACL|nr:MarR family transcriptional regulator [Paenibacillus monticola]MRN54307.1 MarR family transcriptional regulator [Paenibacillus monticola]